MDTSIPSAYYDTSKPVRQLMTQHWFQSDARRYDLYTSVIAIEEIDRLKNNQKKQNIMTLILENDVQILEITDDAVKIAKIYMEKGAIPKTEVEDAYHIAIATLAEITCLASWNFKHIVSANPIRKIHEINEKNDLVIIEIGSLEIYGGYKYGNL